MDKKVKNNDNFVVDEMIKNYWNVLCDGQKWEGKIPLDVNSSNEFYKGCVAGFVVFLVIYGVLSVIF
jgi:hypothetical protein